MNLKIKKDNNKNRKKILNDNNKTLEVLEI
jgi:hypothetical protein